MIQSGRTTPLRAKTINEADELSSTEPEDDISAYLRRNKGPLSIRFARPECIMDSDIDHEQRAFLDVTNLLEQPLGKLAFSRYLADAHATATLACLDAMRVLALLTREEQYAAACAIRDRWLGEELWQFGRELNSSHEFLAAVADIDMELALAVTTAAAKALSLSSSNSLESLNELEAAELEYEMWNQRGRISPRPRFGSSAAASPSHSPISSDWEPVGLRSSLASPDRVSPEIKSPINFPSLVAIVPFTTKSPPAQLISESETLPSGEEIHELRRVQALGVSSNILSLVKSSPISSSKSAEPDIPTNTSQHSPAPAAIELVSVRFKVPFIMTPEAVSAAVSRRTGGLAATIQESDPGNGDFMDSIQGMLSPRTPSIIDIKNENLANAAQPVVIPALFDPVVELIVQQLQNIHLPAFLASIHYMHFLQWKDYCRKAITLDSFEQFRVVGRGFFGKVRIVMKRDTRKLFACKIISKSQIKARHEERLTMNERNMLAEAEAFSLAPIWQRELIDAAAVAPAVQFKRHMSFSGPLKALAQPPDLLDSQANVQRVQCWSRDGDAWLRIAIEVGWAEVKVLALKYAFRDSESVYMVTAYCPGGDLQYHLDHAPQNHFTLHRARFYAAEVVLGYRDLKPDNLLLTAEGHCLIVDLGIAHHVCAEVPITDSSGTPEYWAPEAMSRRTQTEVADWWSFGVLLHRLLSGKNPKLKKPPNHSRNEFDPFSSEEIETVVARTHIGAHPPRLLGNIAYPLSITPLSADLLDKLFVADPKQRLGSDELGGTEAIKAHPFFASINWVRLATGRLVAPFIPPANKVNATKECIVEPSDPFWGTYWDEEQETAFANFDFTSERSEQAELVEAMATPNFQSLLEREDGDQTLCCLCTGRR